MDKDGADGVLQAADPRRRAGGGQADLGAAGPDWTDPLGVGGRQQAQPLKLEAVELLIDPDRKRPDDNMRWLNPGLVGNGAVSLGSSGLRHATVMSFCWKMVSPTALEGIAAFIASY